MNIAIEKLLNELTSYGENPLKVIILKQAENSLGINKMISLITKLMQWHKKVILWSKKSIDSPNENIYNKDYYQPISAMIENYKGLFENCPELSELYELKNDKIYFNSSLTDEEKQEILDYVDENYKIVRHSYGRKS
ncbi:hypothetical protein [Chryseobacterium viscerum]|uniref:Uncharacterized protein n=1 Tax=Chryseobacterium viscerum TaxID=1037377 RepID=A0A5N4BTW5_9FLAO|nr:hypothetical protein [Chryseobacterium viscerum]KAB1231866.1 hypothetical protein F8D52_04310 [Chryseobacterium viscerum]